MAMAQYEGLRRFFTEAIHGWHALESTPIVQVQQELAGKLGIGRDLVEKYQAGDERPPYERFKKMVHELSQHAHLSMQWMEGVYRAYFDDYIPEGPLSPLPEPRPVHNAPLQTRRKFVDRALYWKIIDALNDKNASASAFIIYGVPGIGKTSVVLKVFYDSLERQPDAPSFDGLVWIDVSNLKGQELLDIIFDAIRKTFNSPDLDVSIDKLWGRRKVLLFLDNLHPDNLNLDQAAFRLWLGDLPSNCKIIITSPIPADELNRVRSRRVAKFELEGMQKEEALEMIKQLPNLAAYTQQLDDREWNTLLQITNKNPKAIEMAVSLLKAEYQIDDLSREIKDREIFDALFSLAWEKIKAEPDAQSVLRTMSLFPKDASLTTISRVTGLPNGKLNRALKHLASYALIEYITDLESHHKKSARVYQDERIRSHALVQGFAGRRLDKLSADKARPIYKRWVQYYLEFVAGQLRRNEPGQIYWNTLINSQDLRLTKVDHEWPNIQAVLDYLVVNQDYPDLINFMIVLAHFMDHRGYYSARLKYAEQAANGGSKLLIQNPDDKLAHKVALLWIDMLGWLHLTRGDYAAAETAFTQGETCFSQNPPGDIALLAEVFRVRLCLRQMELADAHQRQALVQEAQAKAQQIYAQIERCSPPIKLRIATACGEVEQTVAALGSEIEQVRAHYRYAVAYFTSALDVEKSYGGEEGAADELRILRGFTYLALAATDPENAPVDDLDNADTALLSVMARTNTIEELWRKYGLSCIAWVKGQLGEALDSAEKVEAVLLTMKKETRLGKRLRTLLDHLRAQKPLPAGYIFIYPSDLLVDVHQYRSA